LADIVLDANDHVRLDEAVIAVALEMSPMHNERIFVDEAYPCASAGKVPPGYTNARIR
jgi:hypothetical protein